MDGNTSAARAHIEYSETASLEPNSVQNLREHRYIPEYLNAQSIRAVVVEKSDTLRGVKSEIVALPASRPGN
jgi:hypothetical protein